MVQEKNTTTKSLGVNVPHEMALMTRGTSHSTFTENELYYQVYTVERSDWTPFAGYVTSAVYTRNPAHTIDSLFTDDFNNNLFPRP